MSAAIQHLERAMVGSAIAKTSAGRGGQAPRSFAQGLYLKRLRYGMEIDRLAATSSSRTGRGRHGPSLAIWRLRCEF